ncbi:MAG: hypothetical protein J4G16_13450 [Acidobacteria bacterium]|nr:hypothetical protein [Acidobacteriota bacterium]
MTPGTMSPLRILSAAEALIKSSAASGAGLWPRTAAALGRQAIEGALRQYWRLREPGLERCSTHSQLLCLAVYFRDRELARQTSATWSALSRACHHHPYELNPTVDELRAWLASAGTFANEVAQQTGKPD